MTPPRRWPPAPGIRAARFPSLAPAQASVRFSVLGGQRLFLVAVDPPGLDVGPPIGGLLVRNAELVPIGVEVDIARQLRHDVVVPQQDTVERMGSRQKVIAVRGED